MFGYILLGFFIVVGIPAIISTLNERKNANITNEKQTHSNRIENIITSLQKDKLVVKSEKISTSREGFCAVYGENFDFFVSVDGNTVLGPFTKILTDFGEGLAAVLIGKCVYYINYSGEKVLGPFKENKDYEISYHSFVQGYAYLHVKYNHYDAPSRQIIIDKQGKIVLNLESFVYGFREDLYIYEKNGNIFFADNKGKTKLGPYKWTWNNGNSFFSHGYAAVRFDDGFWYIDKAGNKKFGPFKEAMAFKNEVAVVKLTDDKIACIDLSGNIIWHPNDNREYSLNRFASYCYEDFVIFNVKNENRCCLINIKNNKVIGPFQECSRFKDGYAIIDDGSFLYPIPRVKVINVNGEVCLDFKSVGLVTDMFHTYSYNLWIPVKLKNSSNRNYFFVNIDKQFLKLSKEAYDKIYNQTMDTITTAENSELIDNPFINEYKKIWSDEKLEDYLSKIAKNNKQIRTNYASNNKLQESISVSSNNQNLTEQLVYSNSNQEKSNIHIIGVQFDTYQRGCYYYLGDNGVYNLGDRVLVPTSNNGNKEATVVFRKIYKNGETTPYPVKDLKSAIRKIGLNAETQSDKKDLVKENNTEGSDLDDTSILKKELARAIKLMERDKRYPFVGEFGLDWEEFLPMIVHINKDQKKDIESMVDNIFNDNKNTLKNKNYLGVTIGLFSIMEATEKMNSHVYYYIVNYAALKAFKENNYSTDDIKNMLTKYKEEFDKLSHVGRNELPVRDNILYTILVINILSYRAVATNIRGVYSTEGIKKFFIPKLHEMIV